MWAVLITERGGVIADHELNLSPNLPRLSKRFFLRKKSNKQNARGEHQASKSSVVNDNKKQDSHQKKENKSQ